MMPKYQVVVPAYQAAAEIGQCLEALITAGFEPQDIIVIDDLSNDGTGDIALGFGVKVIRNTQQSGPSLSRNHGANLSQSTHIVFVDADVVVNSDVKLKIEKQFLETPDLVALFGSYDDQPLRTTNVSFYRNYLHHFVHQNSNQTASTFWTGLGVVRRGEFEKLGGFDQDWENIEDVEFGLRLWKIGSKINLDPTLQCRHLKIWNFVGSFKTDLFGRAFPWARLILTRGAPTDGLNLSRNHRVSLMLVAMMILCISTSLIAPIFLLGSFIALLVFYVINMSLFSSLTGKLGIMALPQIVGLHLFHYLAGGLGLTAALGVTSVQWLRNRFSREPLDA